MCLLAFNTCKTQCSGGGGVKYIHALHLSLKTQALNMFEIWEYRTPGLMLTAASC